MPSTAEAVGAEADYVQLIDDLEAEESFLASLLSPELLGEATIAASWSVGDTVSHLLSTDRSALLAIEDPDAFIARRNVRLSGAPNPQPEKLAENGVELLEAWRVERARLIEAFRALDASARVVWHGPSMSARSFATARLMEYWAHGEDLALAIGVVPLPTDRLRHICHLGAITRDFSFRVHGREVPDVAVFVDLVLPSGATWTYGEESAGESIRGQARDFCLVVTQRRHVEDTSLVTVGTVAATWMQIAQAFAGGPTVTAEDRRGLPV